jgi:hypothetical protein
MRITAQPTQEVPMNAYPISAPVSATLALMVQYTRERRSAKELCIVATDPSKQRLYSNQYRRLSDAMNFTTIKALRAGYDMDMLAWLVQASTDRQLEELACNEAQDADTLGAIIETMRAPKVKARKATAPVVASDEINGVVAALGAVTTRKGASEALDGLTVAKLRQVSKALGLGAQSKLRKAELVDSLIHFTVGMRMAHAAILEAK